MSKYKIYPKTLYEYHNGINCGVLITEKVMRKLVKLQSQHLERVKRLLNDSEGEVFPSMWTLHYPDGKQTSVSYIDTSANLSDRIAGALRTAQPICRPTVFIAASMQEAREMADARVEELGLKT